LEAPKTKKLRLWHLLPASREEEREGKNKREQGARNYWETAVLSLEYCHPILSGAL